MANLSYREKIIEQKAEKRFQDSLTDLPEFRDDEEDDEVAFDIDFDDLD